MSRRPARHARDTSRYEARHIKPGTPGPAAAIGTAAKAVPASLAAGAAGSALVLSGTASAATIPSAGSLQNATDLAAAKTAAGTWVTQGRHAAARTAYTTAAARTTYTVARGDTLSAISGRFCGTSADYASLAAASGITDPNVITPGQTIKLRCHHRVPVHRTAPARAVDASASSGSSGTEAAPAQQSQAPAAVPSGGMSAFESCVITAESGGNPTAVNPVSGAGGLFQFLPSTWATLGFAGSYPGGAQTAPVGVQEAAFNKLYAEAGTSPWAPYDGC